MRRVVFVCLAVCWLVCSAMGQALERGPSTPEERQKVVAIAKRMEQKPLDKSQRKEQEWALQWIEDVPDVHVDICREVLGDFADSDYRYRSILTVQLTLSSAAFLIEHPQQADDQVGEFMAGVESTLRAYRSILRQNPKEKSPELDGLVAKQARGELQEFVRKAAEECDSGNDSSSDMLHGY